MDFGAGRFPLGQNPLDLDPDGTLFNNKISYFNECKDLLKKFIIKIPYIFSNKIDFKPKLEEFINFHIMSETLTLKKKW